MLDLSSRKVYGALAEQCVGGDAKADKVETAVAGHLAGLDSNGNLTDSGVSPAEDVTVEGNPVTFESPFEQDAKSVVVSVKPIQAGSGTPSPENIRPISGIDELEIGVSDGESAPTATTIPLPSTLYGGDVDVTEGEDTPTYGMVDLGSLDYSATAIDNQYFAIISPRYKAPTSLSVKPNWICESYDIGLPTYTDSLPLSNYTIGCFADFSQNNIVFVRDPRCSSAAEMKTALNGVKLVYELATPETPISLTPAIIELLEGTNVVSTNAEKVAVTYGRSLWQDINKLKNDTEGKLNKSDVADVEGDTASRAYSVNEFMLRSDGLYKVTQPIAQNASITASNTTKTTIGAVLTALLNA